MNGQKAINEYARVNRQSLVNEASPHQLITMLISGAIERLTYAKGCMHRNETGTKAEMISKAMDILNALQTSLDMDNGGEISASLDQLYDYMLRRLLTANAQNDLGAIEEVIALLLQIKSGWDQIPQEFHYLTAQQSVNPSMEESPA